MGSKSARSAILPQVTVGFNTAIFASGPQRLVSTVPDVKPDGTVGFIQRAIDVPSLTRGNFALNVTVNQLLYDGGKWWNQMALAGAQEEAAQGQLHEQQLASELEAIRRYYELAKAQWSLQVFEQAVSRSTEQVQRAQGLYEAGRAQQSEWLDARTNRGNDAIPVLRQKQQVRIARRQLLQWIGRPDEDVEIALSQDAAAATSIPNVDRALKTARAQRPLFKALSAQVEANESAIAVAHGDLWPRLSVSGAYQRTSPSADPFFTDLNKQNQLSGSVNLTWNVFNGLETLAQIDRSKTELRLTQATLRQAIVDLEVDVRRSVEALETELLVLNVARQNLDLTLQQVKLEEERYAAGAGSTLEVRNAQIKLMQAQLGMLSGQADVAIAQAAVERTVGGKFEVTP